ncbi:hypothetical protein GYMLUDRAFT_934566 [Collybiopsis luxurians FD-317 M1]|nr:hypothetical protein GYMLUDRAFT_934566 [Collybiopsis luxurians FD-317 M1]
MIFEDFALSLSNSNSLNIAFFVGLAQSTLSIVSGLPLWRTTPLFLSLSVPRSSQAHSLRSPGPRVRISSCSIGWTFSPLNHPCIKIYPSHHRHGKKENNRHIAMNPSSIHPMPCALSMLLRLKFESYHPAPSRSSYPSPTPSLLQRGRSRVSTPYAFLSLSACSCLFPSSSFSSEALSHSHSHSLDPMHGYTPLP